MHSMSRGTPGRMSLVRCADWEIFEALEHQDHFSINTPQLPKSWGRRKAAIDFRSFFVSEDRVGQGQTFGLLMCMRGRRCLINFRDPLRVGGFLKMFKFSENFTRDSHTLDRHEGSVE